MLTNEISPLAAVPADGKYDHFVRRSFGSGGVMALRSLGLTVFNLNVRFRCPSFVCVRTSIYGPQYREPITCKQDLEAPLPEDDERRYLPIKPLDHSHSFTFFHDPVLMKFTNRLMVGGRKALARKIMCDCFELIKRRQVKRYLAAETDEERAKIECNPFIIFRKAIDNCCPVVQLLPASRGGIVYQVPSYITESGARAMAIKWIITTCRVRGHNETMAESLCKEFLDAYNNESLPRPLGTFRYSMGSVATFSSPSLASRRVGSLFIDGVLIFVWDLQVLGKLRSSDPFCFVSEDSLFDFQSSWEEDVKFSSEQCLITGDQWPELRGFDDWDERLFDCFSKEGNSTVSLDAVLNEKTIGDCGSPCVVHTMGRSSGSLIDNELISESSISSVPTSHSISSIPPVTISPETQLHSLTLDHNFGSKVDLCEWPLDMKKRKKCLNRQAALRYRQKKKSERAALDNELSMLQRRNTELKMTVNELMEPLSTLCFGIAFILLNMQLAYTLMRGFTSCRSVLGASLRQCDLVQRNRMFIASSLHCRYNWRLFTCNAASKVTEENATKVEQNKESDQSSGSSPTETVGEDLEKKVTELKERISGIEDKYMRALAENENLRARMTRQVEEAKLFGVQSLCKDLLEIADILQLAADSVSPDVLKSGQDELKNLHSGVLMTRTQLLKIFSRHGLTPLNPIGEKFDPNFHEAVFEVDDVKKDPGTVAIVQKMGYILHQRCLRAAQVGVVKAR
ncbi:hypothetical protein M514_03619 [Trichuris suis]|uniref:BZIP domain-containing protein n=1 Tax=Trichuris suis TaxID=68888 RepID=A0A085N0J9_9BILA|nr:hypothetical protein M514_03619 [Trichuris suis]